MPAYSLSITEAHKQIRSRKLSITEWVKDSLERILLIEPQSQVWAYFNPKQILEQAQKLEKSLEGKDFSGELTGALIGVKDIFNTIDMPTCMGSPIWKNFTPGNDARTVFYIKQAGGLIAGKTATAEFAVHALCDTLNPYHSLHTPGTSSTGSAVAVATGMVPAALGTQTAGSIIRPSSFCGIYGMKPSFGLIPRTGTLKTTDTLDTIGFFSRSPEDLQKMFDVLHVKGLDYPISHQALTDSSRQSIKDRPWRVALVKPHVWKNAEAYAQKAIEHFCQKLAAHPSIELTVKTLSEPFEKSHTIHSVIYEKTLSYYFKEEFKDESLISPILNEMIRRGMKLTLADYKKAIDDQQHLTTLLDSLFRDTDIFLTLSTSGEAPLRDVTEKDDSCLIWTLCGIPTINLPIFKSPSSLPFGAQIAARRYNDPLLLKFCSFLKSEGLISDAEIKTPEMHPRQKT